MDRASARRSRIKLRITVERTLMDWVDKQVESLRFRTRSHGFEYALVKLIETEKKESAHEIGIDNHHMIVKKSETIPAYRKKVLHEPASKTSTAQASRDP